MSLDDVYCRYIILFRRIDITFKNVEFKSCDFKGN